MIGTTLSADSSIVIFLAALIRCQHATRSSGDPSAPLPESTFSIQLVPAYVISSLARTFGASASTAFIVLTGIAGLLASISIFWLLETVTGNARLAAAGTLFVL